MFAARAICHTALKFTPTELVLGRDTILPIQYLLDLEIIQLGKQKLINYNNKRENSKIIAHTYKVNNQVLLERIKDTKYGERDYDAP